TAYDQFGEVLASQPAFTWTVPSGGGTLTAGGLYTAPAAPGITAIQATGGSVRSNAVVTIVDAAPAVASPASASPDPVAATTTTLSVLGADDGGESNLTYTWATIGTPPAAVTFSANGTNAARDTTATFSK